VWVNATKWAALSLSNRWVTLRDCSLPPPDPQALGLLPSGAVASNATKRADVQLGEALAAEFTRANATKWAGSLSYSRMDSYKRRNCDQTGGHVGLSQNATKRAGVG
jgi:hypothetical protein